MGYEKLTPSREKDRWEHALTRPVSSRTKFELLELMRADLFEYLDVLTTDPNSGHDIFLDRLPIGGFSGHIYLAPIGRYAARVGKTIGAHSTG